MIFSCEKKDDSVIDPSYKSPLISNPYRSKDTVFTISTTPVINFNTSITVNPNEGGDIRSVKCKIYNPKGVLMGTFAMLDNGIAPDSVSGDGRYSCTVNIDNIYCLTVGVYSVQYIAENVSGLSSNQINSSMQVAITNNQPPVISGLIAPDSIVVPVSGAALNILSVFAVDSNGYCDIKNVSFKSFRPDGTPTNNGNPFDMYDDGNIQLHGDTVAGDGRFSLIIQILSTQNIFGYYKFIYQAQDNSNALSNQIIDSIKIVPPAKTNSKR